MRRLRRKAALSESAQNRIGWPSRHTVAIAHAPG
jgi:hypothetical protein